jgi:hypothetical protein
MSKMILLVLAILVFTPCFAFAQKSPTLELEGRYWIPDLSGKVKASETFIDTEVDLKGDLGIKDENFPEARVTWYTGPKSKIRLAYTQAGFEGDENLDRTIEFDGQTYTVGTRVETDVKVRYLRLGWAWQFIDIGKGVVKLGTLLEGKGFWGKVTLEAPDLSPSLRESEKFLFGLPTLGIALDINPHKMINIFAEASGLTAGSYGYVYDAEVGVKLIPVKFLSIIGGYRIFDIKAKHNDDYAKLRLHGPFAGATLRF